MEPLRQSRDGKENDGMTAAAQQQPSPGCRPSPAASPAASDGSSTRKRPALGGHPEVSPLADPMRKRHRPGSPASTSNSPAAERESSAEAAARRQLAALSSPSGRPGGGAAQVQPGSSPEEQQAPAGAAAPPPPPPPPPPAHWWVDRPLQPLKREAADADQDAYSLLPGHPLLALACEGHAALLAKVLDNGGNADAQDSRGLTALHLASRHARLACVKVLLEAGAQQLRDRQGCTPLELAQQEGHNDVLDMVRQHEEVQTELQRQAGEQRRQLAEEGGAAGEGET